MIYTHAAAALLGASIAAVGAYKVQDWRYTGQLAALKVEHLEELDAATREARAKEQARFATIQKAQNDAAKRNQTSRTSASASRSVGDQLRDENSAAMRTSRESLAACTQYGAAIGGLFDQCQGDLGAMAERAQGHANDVIMLLEAWPK